VANYGYTLPRFDEYFTANRTINLTGFRPRFTYRHVAESLADETVEVRHHNQHRNSLHQFPVS